MDKTPITFFNFGDTTLIPDIKWDVMVLPSLPKRVWADIHWKRTPTSILLLEEALFLSEKFGRSRRNILVPYVGIKKI